MLRVLACATIFRAIALLYIAIQRLRGRSMLILAVATAHTSVLIALTPVLAHAFGVVGVAVAWVSASVPVALAVTPALVRFLRGTGPEPLDGPQPEPVRAGEPASVR